MCWFSFVRQKKIMEPVSHLISSGWLVHFMDWKNKDPAWSSYENLYRTQRNNLFTAPCSRLQSPSSLKKCWDYLYEISLQNGSVMSFDVWSMAKKWYSTRMECRCMRQIFLSNSWLKATQSQFSTCVILLLSNLNWLVEEHGPLH